MKPKLNPRIFQQIEKLVKGDKSTIDILHNLIFEEAQHSGNWWYKQYYRDIISKYAAGVDNNED